MEEKVLTTLFMISAFIPFVDDLEVLPLQEAAHLWFSGEHDLHELPHHLLLVALRCGRVPLLQSQLPLPAKEQHEAHLHRDTTQREGKNRSH